MAEQDHQAEEQGMLPSEGEEFAKRRQVIKGLVSAVPVIMTVSSASAMGANASSMQCITTNTAQPADCVAADPGTMYPTGVFAHTDGWYREYLANTSGRQGGGINNNGDAGLCLVYVDADGTPTGATSFSNYPLSASCGTSFNFT